MATIARRFPFILLSHLPFLLTAFVNTVILNLLTVDYLNTPKQYPEMCPKSSKVAKMANRTKLHPQFALGLFVLVCLLNQYWVISKDFI